MNNNRLMLIHLAFLSFVIFNSSCTNKEDVQSLNNKIVASINDSLDITIIFNDENNIGTIILENKNNYTSNIYGYQDDGVTPVLNGKEINGQLEGVYLTYYPNGFLNTKSFFIGGQLDGYYEGFSENGTMIYKALFRDGIEKSVILKDSILLEPEILKLE